MFWSVGGAYFATSDSCKTYSHDLWLSESNGLWEADIIDKSVKLERVKAFMSTNKNKVKTSPLGQKHHILKTQLELACPTSFGYRP